MKHVKLYKAFLNEAQFKDLQIGDEFLRFGKNGQLWVKTSDRQAKFVKNVGKKTAKYNKSSGSLEIFPPTMDITLKSVNEGILDMFKKTKKDTKKNKYNPNEIGYGHPDFDKEHIGFSPDPEQEIEEASKKAEVISKKISPLITKLEAEFRHIHEMMLQQDMVNGDDGNNFYLNHIKEFLNELESVGFKIEKGIW